MSLSTRAFAGFVLIASAIVLGTALLSQYWGGLAPCELCLLQRWPWAAAIVVSLVLVLVGERARARGRLRDQRRFRLLSCRRRAALVRRPERLHRRPRRCDDTRTDEAADPPHGAGPVRPPGLDIVRGVLGRLEPARVANHDRLLRWRASACPWGLAARARRQSSSARGGMTSDIPGRPP